MNEMFSQGGKGSTGILTNKQAIARKFGVKQNEVVYFAVGVDLGGYKVIYDKSTQRAYSLPVLSVGTTAVSLNEHAILVHSTGTVDLGELAATRREFVSLFDSFATGLVVNTRNELLFHNGIGYTYLGSLPVTITAGTNPVGNADWKPQTDPDLRAELASSTGGALIGHVPNIAALRAATVPSSGDMVRVGGYYTDGDLGGGYFVWDSSSAMEEDGGYVIKSSMSAAGAWVRYSKADEVRLTEFGLKSDGSDESAKLAAAFNRANVLKKSVNLDGDYRAQDLVFDGLTNVRVHGVGKGKLVDNCNKVLFTFKNCNGLDIDGIDVDGNKDNQTSTTQQGTPDGVGLIRVEQCANWKIRNCDIHDNRLGAAVLIVDNGTNQSTNWQGSIQNGLLYKNYIHDNGVTGVVMSDGVFSWSHSTVISDNVIRRCTDYGIALDYSERTIVKSNIISDVFVAIGVLGVDDLIVDGNNYANCELGIAVSTSGNPGVNPYISRNVTIVNNKGRDIIEVTALGDGITVDPSCENIIISNNTVQNAKRGIAVDCQRATVTDNIVIDCRSNSFFFNAKAGVFGDNIAVKNDGTYPAPSHFSGAAAKRVVNTGRQDIDYPVTLTTSPLKVCELKSVGDYAAAYVTIIIAALINSVGPVFVRKSYSIKKSDGSYTIAQLDTAGDTDKVNIEINDTSGTPSLYMSLSTGTSTPTTVSVNSISNGLSDNVFYQQTV